MSIQFRMMQVNKFRKENNWFRLKGKCFACNKGNDEDTQNHRKKNCCSENGYLYINNECNISECDNPSFVLHLKFNCGSHDPKNNEG